MKLPPLPKVFNERIVDGSGGRESEGRSDIILAVVVVLAVVVDRRLLLFLLPGTLLSLLPSLSLLLEQLLVGSFHMIMRVVFAFGLCVCERERAKPK